MCDENKTDSRVELMGVLITRTRPRPAPARAWPVRLTLCERRTRGHPALRRCPGLSGTLIQSSFEKAIQNAFQQWKGQSDVYWDLERIAEGPQLENAPAQRPVLGQLEGGSLSGAFAVGLALLYYRNSRALSAVVGGLRPRYQWDSLTVLDDFGESVAGADFSEVAVSAVAMVGNPDDAIEDIVLGCVGESLEKRREVKVLAVSIDQVELPVDEGVVKARTVGDLIKEVFQRQSGTVLDL